MICSDAFAINSRIFDHSAVIKSECKYLVREFELKKNHEHSKSFFDMKIATEKAKQRIPECEEMLKQRIETLHSLVINVASKGMDILSENIDLESLKEKYKKERDQNAEAFFDEMENAQKEVLRKHQILLDELESENSED